MPLKEETSSTRRTFSTDAIQGMPPPQVASMNRPTPDSPASEANSAKCSATTALLEVTTCLPALSAAAMKVCAGSMPPMHSTTTSTSGSETIWS